MESTEFKYDNGDRCKDEISGVIGVITTRADHLFGCNRYWVVPQEHKDGKAAEGGWFDEDALTLLEAAVIKRRIRLGTRESVAPEPLRRTGGFDVSRPSSGPSTR